jgi:hypothetical protein
MITTNLEGSHRECIKSIEEAGVEMLESEALHLHSPLSVW